MARRPASTSPSRRRSPASRVRSRPPPTQLETARVEGAVNNPDGTPGQVRLLAKQGACDHLEITGACPTSPGEAMLLAGDAEYSGLEIGDQVTMDGLPGVTVVGIYRVPAAEQEFWYDVSRFDSVPRRIVEITRGSGPSIDPYMPGPLVVDPAAFDAVPVDLWRVRADRRLELPPDWTECRPDRRGPIGRRRRQATPSRSTARR